MDSGTLEPKPTQGAASSADFSQHDNHAKVIDRKSSAVSFDEERLAVGISTIGLQTKRLSGAQRRKLTTARKMREGPWMEEKPPGKTTLSQDGNVVGSSGGMKISHLDSCTPSLETQQLKKPSNTQVQTGPHKKAVEGIRMAIIQRRHTEVKLNQTQAEMIQAKLLTAVDANPLGEAPPQFLHSRFAQGVFWITCANESSKVWLMRTVSELGELWEGAELTVTDSKNLPESPRVFVRIPDTSEAKTVMTRLSIQNPELNTTDWSIMRRKVREREQTLTLSIDTDSFKVLASSNFKAFWGLGKVTFRTLNVKKTRPEAESTASDLPPQ
jgi:hypothetical protein